IRWMPTLMQGPCQFHSLAVKRGFLVPDILFQREKCGQMAKIPVWRKNFSPAWRGAGLASPQGARLAWCRLTLTRPCITVLRNQAAAAQAPEARHGRLSV